MGVNVGPHRRADTAETRWVLFRVQEGDAMVIGVCSSQDSAAKHAHGIIRRAVGQIGRMPPWTPLPTGGKLLLYERADKRFQFRAEPWLVDAAV